MRGGLHIQPGVGICQNTLVVPKPDILDLSPDPIGLVVGKAKLDGPDQRKDIDRKQQEYRWRDEYPGDCAVG